MRADDFRLAVGSRIMRSTDCRLSDEGDSIVLSHGRGFGHGMGLCQWGMHPFGATTAQRLMTIASHKVISDRHHGSDLPVSWRTLYAILGSTR